MADTKKGRDKKAHDAENRQRKRELEQERDRADEAEPPQNEANEVYREGNASGDSSQECRRRGCNELAAFLVLERYQEETGHGAVEAEAALCEEHTAEESPTNLDGVYADYVFQVTPLLETSNTDTA
ncbi:hypothetical protein [Halalkalicoccus salilacus]|uniref:hypothetical protein n=1 Tax=Halalkalicoccus salilacus TaxID=3117459 RepID=UPI00300EF1D5